MEPPKRQYKRSSNQRLTRRRVPVSCAACQTRKLKCNREKPCQNCTARGESNAAACTYTEKSVSKQSAKLNSRSDRQDMRKRIDRLEKSILSVISSEKDNDHAPRQSISTHVTDDDQTDEDESLRLGEGPKVSIDSRSTHWDAILNDLGAMKDAWSEENDNAETFAGSLSPSPKHHRPSLVDGLTPPPERSTVMASLPSRAVADNLVARFFSDYNPGMPVRYAIHKTTFYTQYNDHWTDPSKTNITWVGLLFGILCHALQSYRRSDIEPPDYQGTSAAAIQLYRIRAAECLIITGITRPVKFMIQAMLVYSMAEYADESDTDMGTWLLSGHLLRLALHEGYHRDPSQYPNISPFDGEMRRRLWFFVSQHELLFSVKVGLPRGIRFAECDARAPRNLHDEELYPGMKELPPSRPNTEQTDVSYFIAKLPIMRAYGNVIEFLHIVEPQPYQEVLRLDRILIESLETIPAMFRFRSFEEMKYDSPHRIMERCFIHSFYHKAVCILHRKYWSTTPLSDKSGFNHYSRDRCVGSSIAILDQQVAMHEACRKGGPISSMKWYQFSVMNHDLILAAMIICLDLVVTNRVGSTHQDSIAEMQQKMNAIKRSKAIWEDIIHCCRDARSAVTILNSALGVLSDTTETTHFTASGTNNITESLRFNLSVEDKPTVAAPLPIYQPNGDEMILQEELMSSGDFFDMLATDPDITTSFDWDAWDQFVANQPLEHTLELYN